MHEYPQAFIHSSIQQYLLSIVEFKGIMLDVWKDKK